MVVIYGEHIVGNVPLIHIHMSPLSALRLMTRHGIGVLYLQGIIVLILANLLQTVFLVRYVSIVLHDALKELLLLFACQCRSFGAKGVKKRHHLHLVVVVVGEAHPYVGKGKAVHLVHIPYSQHLCPVAVSYEGRDAVVLVAGCLLLCPVVVVLYHHEHVAGGKDLLTVEDAVAYPIIIYVSPFV